MFLDIKVSFNSENIDRIYADDEFQWFFKIKCSQCNEVHPNFIDFNIKDQVDTQNSKSQCNFFMNCKQCKKNMQISVYDKSKLEVRSQNDKGNGILATFECRGVEILEWDLQEGLSAQAKGSGIKFNKMDLSDIWCDYDEESGQQVQIENFKIEIQKNKQLK